jgi:hypothetical protein
MNSHLIFIFVDRRWMFRNEVVDKKNNEFNYEHPKRTNCNINSEPHNSADTRDKKTLNYTDMRQANDRNSEELNHLFRLESLQKHPPERIQQKRLLH